ncbi:MAG TPA: oligosaccharide flippase family protein [Nocardioidaceae bacterium]|nr:oligosaccharide flippase family protein [Nocardioidaceae bacterium]
MSRPTTSRSTLRGGAVIAVAMGVMNVSTYGFTILAARLLGPAEYGALAAVMGVLLVVNVLSLGLQATGARRVSAAPHDLRQIEREVMTTSYVSAVLLGLLLVLAVPVVTSTLNLDSWGAAALIAVTAVPLSVMGAQAGILQGERRWGALAGIYLAVGVGRLGFGAVALLLEPDTLGAMTGVALGSFLPVLVGWLALRDASRRRAQDRLPRSGGGHRWAAGGVLRETLHNSHALLAFFALSNTDVIVARSTLDEHQAGLYAGGLILAKAVLFLPQFVVVVAFPSMSRQDGDRRSKHLLGLAMVAGIGLVTVLGVGVLSTLAVVFIGGPEYAALQDRLWVFAALGTLLALLQLMVYDVVARQHQRMVYVVWAGMAALLMAAPFVGSVTGLLSAVVTIDAVLLTVLLLASLRSPARGSAPAPTDASVT